MSEQIRRHRNPTAAIAAGRRTLSSEGRAPRTAGAALPLALAIAAILGTGNAYAGSAPSNANFGSPAWFAQQRGAVTSTQTASTPGQILTPSGQPFDTTSLVQKSMTNLAAAAKAIVAQQNAQSGQGLRPTSSAAVPGAVVTPGAAQARAAQSMQDLNAALTAIQNQLAVQSASQTAAVAGPNNLGADPNHPGQTLPNVSNGLGTGALAPAKGIATDPTLWQNAQAPTQATKNGQTTVTVNQTQQKAVLTWDSFNVGKNTTVYFDQAAGTAASGTNNWIALNRIVDPSDVPSQILGSIKAEGTVYLLNQNGIIFGGSSQVNTHSLMATSLNFLGDTSTNQMVPGSVAYDAAVKASNDFFLESSNTAGFTNFSSPSAATFDDTPLTQAGLKAGGVTLKAGAAITTGDAGFTLLVAPRITNAGSVIAQGGTAALIADDQASVNPGDSTPGSGIYTVTGLEGAANGVTNTGLVQATTGNVTLIGNAVVQAGVVEATTGITRAGSIDIMAESAPTSVGFLKALSYAVGPLTLGAGSLTALLPEENGQTTSSSAASTAEFATGSVNLQGGAVTLQSGSLLYAPGQSVSVTALPIISSPNAVSPVTADAIYGRIYVDHGAVIDVSGLPDVQLPMSANQLTIGPLTANELADAPLQRQSALLGQSITIDTRITGVNAETGQAWVGSPLIDASGNVQASPRKIDQLLVNGGSLALTGGEVLTATQSVLDVGGGYIHYLGGTVTPTRLIGASGAVYSASDANPLDPIVGFAGQTTVAHTRWGIADVYTNPLMSGAEAPYESDYIQGGNAGSLSIATLVNNFFSNSPSDAVYGSVILNGTLSAAALAGRHQVANGTLPIGGSFTLGPDAGQYNNSVSGNSQSDSTNLNSLNPTVLLAAEGPQLIALDPHFNATTPLATPVQQAKFAADPSNKLLDPTNLLYNSTLSTALLSAADFAKISVSSVALVESDAALSVQAGGTITLVGPELHLSVPEGLLLRVLGQLSAPSGQINLSVPGTGGSIEVGPQAILSARGQWVDDGGLTQDQLSGAAYLNGGSISLKTFLSANLTDPVAAVGSPSIRLDPGSLLDVSSGGYVQPNGALELKNGVPVGRGGSITLSSYNGTYTEGGVPPPANGSLPTTGGVAIDGTLLGYGFAGGGTLSIQTLGFQIGGDPSRAPAQDLALSASFFDQGFGAYNLQAVFDATVTAGTTLNVTQRNLIPDVAQLLLAPTGSNLYHDGLVMLGSLDAYHRQPTNLSLSAGAYLSWNQSSEFFSPPIYPGVTGTVLIDRGASIVADAGARVTLSGQNQVTVLGAITAPGGSITLSNNSPGSSPAGTYLSDLTGSIWLGATSTLNAAGTVLENPYATPAATSSGVGIPLTGEVLPGGSVTLLATNTYLVANAGALIDVSGASGTFDLPQSGAGGGPVTNRYSAATPVWSDAGGVTLGSNFGVFFDGTLSAHGGGASAAGGTLTLQSILPVTTNFGTQNITPAPAILVQSSGLLVPQGLRPGQPVEAGLSIPSGITHFAADRLAGSGISTLVLGANPAALVGYTDASTGGANSISQVAPMTIAFAGSVNLSLAQSLITDTTALLALPQGSTRIPNSVQGVTDIGAPTVTLSAPYVEIGSAGEVNPSNNQVVNMQPTLALAGGTLKVNTGTLDLVGQLGLQNFANAYFTASGDIRASSSLAAAQVAVANSKNGIDVLPIGELVSAGNLSFQANRLYPATAQTFVIDANANGLVDAHGNPISTSVTFLGGGSSSVPLSAGGSLLVDATSITQEGVLRAPSGTITLGVTDVSASASAFNGLPLTQTQTVTLTAGSLTSVSLDGALIPYGSTVDGIDYKYQLSAVPPTATALPTPLDLAAPPAKAITLGGQRIALNSGATIDLSGGGDLQAQEWVPGTGGSRNVLLQSALDYAAGASPTQVSLFPDNRQVYAILPGYSGTVAPYDPAFAQPGSAVGQSVTLSASPGLAAGTYVLLPAEYATLPGAYRVVQNTGVSDALASQNKVLADGTLIVAGTFGNVIGGTTAARTTSFEVQSASVWEQYSAYTLTSANAFFPVLAHNAGAPDPRLPIDAGRLAIGALSTLSLDASIDSATPSGARGAEIDIASQDIEITGGSGTARAGYLALSADTLDSLGAASLLIGGLREDTPSGTTLTALANSIVVANNAQHALTGPEITLLTKSDTGGSDPNAATGLLVTSGSVIRASGALAASADNAITIGSSTASGDGALLRVSNGQSVTVTRANVPATALGTLAVQDGATVSGGQALILDAAGDANFGSGALFSGKSIDADAQRITFVTGGSGIGPTTQQQFSNANAVTLRSSGAIDFAGNIAVALNTGTLTLSAAEITTSTGSAVTLDAPTVILTNTLGAAPVSVTEPGSGSLTVHAGELDFGTGETASASAPVTTAFYGFGSVNASAAHGIAVQGTGGIFDFGNAAVTLAAPLILADTGSTQTITTTAALTLNPLTGTALSRSALAGSITVSGGSISDGIEISAPAGDVTLLATTGNLSLSSGSSIDTQGVAVPFYDQVEYAPGGSISLTAASGNILVPTSVTLNFAGSAKGGDAGSLAILAPSGVATVLGTLAGQAQTGFAGGSFGLSTGGAVNLDFLAQELKSSGVNNAISIRSGAGNLTLSAGNALTASQIALTADGGAGSAADTASGNLVVNGMLNANGLFGGIIELYGKSSVDVEGSLLARGSDPQQLGGTLILATGGTTDGTYNATYGYENVPRLDSGKITIGANAVLDVTGGSAATIAADGKIGGTILIRAPLLVDGGVNVSVANSASLQGSRASTLEAYAVWSTWDKTTGAQHFDGIIDPSGWYDGSGNLASGTFYAPDGTTPVLVYTAGSMTAAQLRPYLTADYFVPTTSNADHQTFYGYQNGDETAVVPGTLMGFVQNPGLTVPAGLAATASLRVAPGIELDNPASPADGKTLQNDGAIEILTPWNLGALDANGNPVFRLNGIAPILSIRAAGNVLVKASITDGFKQNTDPLPATSAALPGPPTTVFMMPSDYESAMSAYHTEMSAISNVPTAPGYIQYCSTWDGCYQLVDFHGGHISFESTWALSRPATPTALGLSSNTALNSYYEYYLYYAGNALDGSNQNGQQVGFDGFYGELALVSNYGSSRLPGGYDPVGGVPFTFNASIPNNFGYIAAPLPTDSVYHSNGNTYVNYIADYSLWVAQNSFLSGGLTGVDGTTYNNTGYAAYVNAANAYNFNVATLPSPPLPPPAISGPLAPLANLPGVGSYTTYNGPAPVSTSMNPLPLLTANLYADASSSSYRIVAGADFSGANPRAVRPAAIFAPNASGPLAGLGNILIDGHNAFIDSENATASVAGFEIDQPTTIRTGTGSITLAAGANIQLLDNTSPGVIYAAGTPSPVAPSSTITQLSNIYLNNDPTQSIIGYTINTGAVQPFGAGDVMLTAGQNITAGAALGQLWLPWTNGSSNAVVGVGTDSTGNDVSVTLSTAINFGTFEQGVMSVGGNVTVRAGGNIADLNVSSPTTSDLSAPDPMTGAATIITQDNVQSFINFANGNRTTPDNVTAVTLGGGNVVVAAAGDILSGSYWAAKGNETLSAGGQIASNLTAAINLSSAPIPVAAVLGIADGQLNVSARGNVDIAEVYNPTLYNPALPLSISPILSPLTLSVSHQSLYSSSTALQLNSVTGSVTLDSALPDGAQQALPPILDITALQGAITVDQGFALQPSKQTAFNVIANGTVQFAQSQFSQVSAYGSFVNNVFSTFPEPSLFDDSQVNQAAPPARIYSLTGDILDGVINPVSGYDQQGGAIAIDHPALIYAGHDIINWSFIGQNYYQSDITRIVAGHDLYDTQPLLPNDSITRPYVPLLELGGPGTFDIEAGRNLGPLTNILDEQGAANSNVSWQATLNTGIETVGNALDPTLPKQGANLTVLFGIGGGAATASFADQYLDPSKSLPGIPNFGTQLVSFVRQYQSDRILQAGGTGSAPALTPTAAFAAFQNLPVYRQQLLEEQILFGILNQTGLDYNNPASPYSHQYAHGYQAVNTLFPASLGYTQNNLSGGSNGAASPVTTGILDMRSTTIQTQQGGDISIMGPGGELLVGSTGAPPNLNPNLTGILTLEKGNINIFSDQSVLLAQSRIFTEQGGDILIWSSNGDINAGEGAKTSFDLPPAAFVCDFDAFCTPNVLGEVSGAGIGVLQTIPNAPSGNANLIAPRGTIDAGAAGIRVSGNLNIAALQVLNAFNVQVGGRSVGVPTPVHIDTGALAAASSVVTATEAATSLTRGSSNSLDTVITVEVVGFGEPDEDQRKKLRRH